MRGPAVVVTRAFKQSYQTKPTKADANELTTTTTSRLCHQGRNVDEKKEVKTDSQQYIREGRSNKEENTLIIRDQCR